MSMKDKIRVDLANREMTPPEGTTWDPIKHNEAILLAWFQLWLHKKAVDIDSMDPIAHNSYLPNHKSREEEIHKERLGVVFEVILKE